MGEARDLVSEIERLRQAKGCRTVLHAARIYRGIEKAKLAHLVGVSVDVLEQIERGASAPGFVLLKKLAAALNVPADLLVSPLKRRAADRPAKPNRALEGS